MEKLKEIRDTMLPYDYYFKYLNEDYRFWIALNYNDIYDISDDQPVPLDDKLLSIEYLGSQVFNFVTYDGGIDMLWATKMLEVLEALQNKQTFKYHSKSEENYQWYLMMVNMPFLIDILEWGTSIRGAWIEENTKPQEFGLDIEEIRPKEIQIFLSAMFDFIKQFVKE